jgi:hypothetical protein
VVDAIVVGIVPALCCGVGLGAPPRGGFLGRGEDERDAVTADCRGTESRQLDAEWKGAEWQIVAKSDSDRMFGKRFWAVGWMGLSDGLRRKWLDDELGDCRAVATSGMFVRGMNLCQQGRGRRDWESSATHGSRR